MEKDRGSKIIPSLEDSAVQGLQYRRGSKKLSLNDLNETVVRKPGEFDENNEDSMVEETVPDPPVSNSQANYNYSITVKEFGARMISGWRIRLAHCSRVIFV